MPATVFRDHELDTTEPARAGAHGPGRRV